MKHTFRGRISVGSYFDPLEQETLTDCLLVGDTPLTLQLHRLCQRHDWPSARTGLTRVNAAYWLSENSVLALPSDRIPGDALYSYCLAADDSTTGARRTVERLAIGRYDLLATLKPHIGKYLVLQIEREPS